MKKRALSLLMSIALLISLLPASIRAVETPAENVTVTFRFDCRSIATDEMLTACSLSYPAEQTVTVPKGSTVYTALEAAREAGSLTVAYNEGNSMVTGFTDIGAIETLCESFGVTYNENFQYAGWMYSGDHVSGWGIQTDTLNENETITFRYTVYYGQKTQTEWVNFDWDFVDAYYGIQADIASAKALTQSDYTDAQWTTLQSAITAAESALSAVQTADTSNNLTGGLMLNYIAEKQTALWGTNSPTDKLTTARSALKKAVNKVVAPTSVSVTTDVVEIPMGSTYQIQATVLPEGAPQGVTYEAFIGGDAFDLSDSGLISPKKTANTCWVQVKSTEDTTKFAYFKFKIIDAPAAPDVDALLETIAKGYAAGGKTVYQNSKIIIDMAAYEKLAPTTTHKLTTETKQNYVNFVCSAVTDANAAETTYALGAVGLQSIGADPRALYPVNSNKSIDLIAKLNGVEHDVSTWVVPYTLAAYQQGDYQSTATENALIDQILSVQAADGSWGAVDATANIITGLSFYYPANDKVKAAVDKAVSYLSAQQQSDGTFIAYGSKADSDTCANVIMALAAVGINPATDSRFSKGGHSALDGLLSFALADSSGFGYQDNATLNPYATEEGFRALIAAKQVMASGQAYNIYDFSANTVEPARATGSSAAASSDETTGEEITVRMTIKATDGDYWMNNKKVTLGGDGATVYHAFLKALEGSGITQGGAANGYVRSMTKGGETLGEFSAGDNSGWLYKVNGTLATVGLTDYAIENGDHILWYYTKDWTRDPDAGAMAAQPEKKTDTVLAPEAAASNGAASVKIIAAELTAAAKAAEESGEATVTITPSVSGNAQTITLEFPASAAADAAKRGVQIVIETETAHFTLSAEALSALTKSGETIVVTLSTADAGSFADKLSAAARDGAAAVEVTVTVDGAEVTSFDGAELSISFPVSSAHFCAGKVYRVWSIDADGAVEMMTGQCAEKDGVLRLVVKTRHLTTFVAVPALALIFSDVAETAWYYAAVREAYEKGLMTGVTDEAFVPGGTVTRAQFAVVLHRLAGTPASDTALSYTDTSDGAWYADAVRWAAEQGIVNGVDGGRFAPNDALTREQLAVMLYRYAAWAGRDLSAVHTLTDFSDRTDVSAWAVRAMRWAVGSGLIDGADGALLPGQTATRAQLAAILQRFGALGEKESVSAAASAYASAAAYLRESVSAPTVASIGGEWTVLALARGGAAVDEIYFDAYRAALTKTLQESGGVLSTRKYTEYSRVILALTALGEDARSFAGYDLTRPLADKEKTVAQGVNGAIFALLALENAGDIAAQDDAAAVQALRQEYADYILNAQQADGGWSLRADSAGEVDLTAMALQALSGYREQSAVSAAVDRALDFLSRAQQADGGFAASGTANSESCAQVLLALCELGIDADDARFVKNGHSAFDALLAYQTESGGFSHTAGGETNLMASEQAACALAALLRAERGESGFYRMETPVRQAAA